MQTHNRPDGIKPREGLSVNSTVVNDHGFTLIELLLVVAIISILVTIAMAGFSEFKETARYSRCMEEIRHLEREINAFAAEKGTLPANLGDIGRDTLRDPWGSNYVYSPPTRMVGTDPINIDFDLYSKGSDANTADSTVLPPGDDDIIRGRDGGYVGFAKNY